MSEIGINISGQVSKSIEEFSGKDMDLVVTVCKSTPTLSCPFCSSSGVIGRPAIINDTLPNAKRFLEHGFDDPSDAEGSDEEKYNAFRATRDEIKSWIQGYFS